MVRTCLRVKSLGTCLDETCPYNHDVLLCEPCGHVFTDAAVYKSHIGGKKHHKVVSGASRTFQCPTCGVIFAGANWEEHARGRHHRLQTQRVGAPADVQPEEVHVLPGKVHCELCDIFVNKGFWGVHIATPAHKRREKFVAYKAAFEEASKDRHGVTMSHAEHGIDFGIVELQDAEAGVSAELKIDATGASSRIKITDLKLASTASSSRTTSPYVSHIEHCSAYDTAFKVRICDSQSAERS